jgi:multidrug efflux system membrane fusion protein
VWPWLLILVLLAVGAYVVIPRVTRGAAQKNQKNQGRGQAAARSVPVVGAKATIGNMPVYLTGLGTVTALNTVTVRTRVDGELTKVAFREGQMVRQGDLLAEIDPRPFQVQLEQAEGQMARDQATLNNAMTDLNRYQVLISQDAIPRQQLDTQAAAVRQDEGSLKSDQAGIDNARLQLTYAHIIAPLTGRIGLRMVDQGNIVHAADANGLALITQLQPIALIFNISEDELSQVARKVLAGAALPVEAWDRDLTAKISSGTLLTIDNQVDQSTGTVRFKATFPNQDNALFPNQFVNARALADTKRNVVLVPSAAVQRGPDTTFVWVVKPDSTVYMRNVVVGLTEGDQSEINSGLSAGETVVIDGVDKLQPGAKVSVRMSGPGGSSPARNPPGRGQQRTVPPGRKG